jgi:hypothetical protein
MIPPPIGVRVTPLGGRQIFLTTPGFSSFDAQDSTMEEAEGIAQQHFVPEAQNISSPAMIPALWSPETHPRQTISSLLPREQDE